MENFFIIMLAPWLFFVILAMIASRLIKLAKKRKGIAFAFGVFVQMFMPDPLVEQTLKMVQIDKRVVKQKEKAADILKKKTEHRS
mgnify:CR=1 FL=1